MLIIDEQNKARHFGVQSGGVVVIAQVTSDLVEAWSWLSCCLILRQETLLHIVSLPPGVYMGTGDIMLGV